MTSTEESTFQPCWAIVEVFGHQRFAGLVGEQAIAGDKLVRLEIPAIPERREKKRSHYHPTEGHSERNATWEFDAVYPPIPGETKFFGVKAIYAMTPTTEDCARAEAARIAGSRARYENIVSVPLVAQIAAATEIPFELERDIDSSCGPDEEEIEDDDDEF